MSAFRNFIGGSFQEPGSHQTIEVRNPATGQVFAAVPAATEADVIGAVHRAAEAQKPWGRLPAIERGNALRHLADIIEKNAGRIGEALAKESGKSVSRCHG